MPLKTKIPKDSIILHLLPGKCRKNMSHFLKGLVGLLEQKRRSIIQAHGSRMLSSNSPSTPEIANPHHVISPSVLQTVKAGNKATVYPTQYTHTEKLPS